MNSLVIILIGIVALAAGYLLYGGWLAKKWGIDPKAKTPAYTHEDGQDYVPSSKFTVFSHQFSSIAGAGPVTGPILASVFGWVPVFLWLIIGGLFFGAVQDFGALYASVKNEGKSMGMIIEKYIGKTMEVLIDGIKDGIFQGRTRNNKVVHLTDNKKYEIGEFVNVEIERVSTWCCFGKSIN